MWQREVDEQTGQVKVLSIVAAVDVGKLLNYETVVGQIQGGVMMGLGMALSEQFIVENGINLTNSLHKVRLPGAEMTPEIILLDVARYLLGEAFSPFRTGLGKGRGRRIGLARRRPAGENLVRDRGRPVARRPPSIDE